MWVSMGYSTNSQTASVDNGLRAHHFRGQRLPNADSGSKPFIPKALGMPSLSIQVSNSMSAFGQNAVVRHPQRLQSEQNEELETPRRKSSVWPTWSSIHSQCNNKFFMRSAVFIGLLTICIYSYDAFTLNDIWAEEEFNSLVDEVWQEESRQVSEENWVSNSALRQSGSFARLWEQAKLAKYSAEKLKEWENMTGISQIKTSADVEGTNMDHNGSVSNECFTKKSLLRRAIWDNPPHAFQPIGAHSFVFLNGHRSGNSSFVATGLSALSMHNKKKADQCVWVGSQGRVVSGKLYPVWPGEHHDLIYESIILHCKLESETEPGVGGTLLMTVDEETFAAYEEKNHNVEKFTEKRLKYNIGFCSFPIYREVVPERFAEWIQYSHTVLGIEYFLLNDGGSIGEDFMKVLKPFMNAGLVEINDIRGAYRFESKHNVLTLNECIYQMRWIAKWMVVLDFDEYLHIAPPHSLKSLLKVHEDVPWLTFGSLWWSVMICRPSTEKFKEWPLERMTFHWPQHYCVNQDSHGHHEQKCLNYHGHRKYLINPRKVSTVEVHRPIEPIDGGINLNTTDAWINHFQGLIRPNEVLCSEIVRPDEPPKWWVQDTFLANATKTAREANSLLKRWL